MASISLFKLFVYSIQFRRKYWPIDSFVSEQKLKLIRNCSLYTKGDDEMLKLVLISIPMNDFLSFGRLRHANLTK